MIHGYLRKPHLRSFAHQVRRISQIAQVENVSETMPSEFLVVRISGRKRRQVKGVPWSTVPGCESQRLFYSSFFADSCIPSTVILLCILLGSRFGYVLSFPIVLRYSNIIILPRCWSNSILDW